MEKECNICSKPTNNGTFHCDECQVKLDKGCAKTIERIKNTKYTKCPACGGTDFFALESCASKCWFNDAGKMVLEKRESGGIDSLVCNNDDCGHEIEADQVDFA